MKSPLRIIVTGQIAQYPLGGVTWFYLQYVVGLARLGHEVFYIEDSGQWPYNPQTDKLDDNYQFNVDYLANIMARFGLAEKWGYRFPGGSAWLKDESRWFGIPDRKRKEIIESADVLLNVSGTLAHIHEYRQVQKLVYIDTDPVFTQIKLATDHSGFRKLVDAHDVHFSYGECLGHSNTVPDTGHHWLPTRPPVLLSEWHPSAPHREVFTTVMNWTSHNSVSYEGQTFGQKDVEFKKFIELPGLIKPTTVELGIGSGNNQRTPYDLLKYKGWKLVNPAEVCPDLDSFRTYTESSKAEWSVAKNGYVQGQSGWFSERSARYLAAGRPVAVQDTGFTKVIPTSTGIVPFTNLNEAVEAVREINGNYKTHAVAARALAEEYFSSEKVLGALLKIL